jgi:hypothetical protein
METMPTTEPLRQLASSDQCARAFFELAARRERNQTITNVDRALTNLENAGHEFSRQQLLSVFKALNDLGCGEFKVGRRGWPSRFEWSTGIISVGRAAIGEQETVEQIEVTADDGLDTETDWLTHTFHLRPSVEVELELPMDLSPNEARRLTQFIDSLPFELDD